MASKSRMILHDLDAETAAAVLGATRYDDIFSARDKMAACKGCFGCWLRTPGRCILQDGAEDLGRRISACDELVLISESLYGGFSQVMKNALDRCISLCLPFFETRSGEMHHKSRYADKIELKACFYNAGKMTGEERELARDIAQANGLNFNAASVDTVFVDTPDGLREVLG